MRVRRHLTLTSLKIMIHHAGKLERRYSVSVRLLGGGVGVIDMIIQAEKDDWTGYGFLNNLK